MFENLMKSYREFENKTCELRKNLEFNEKNAFFVAEHLKLTTEKYNHLVELCKKIGIETPYSAKEVLQQMIIWTNPDKRMQYEELIIHIPKYFYGKAQGIYQ